MASRNAIEGLRPCAGPRRSPLATHDPRGRRIQAGRQPKAGTSRQEVAVEEGAGRLVCRAIEEIRGSGPRCGPPLMEEDDLVRETPRLSEIVRRHDDLGATLVKEVDDLLDGTGRGRIE